MQLPPSVPLAMALGSGMCAAVATSSPAEIGSYKRRPTLDSFRSRRRPGLPEAALCAASLGTTTASPRHAITSHGAMADGSRSALDRHLLDAVFDLRKARE